MSRDKQSPQDDENRQEPEDIIRFQAPPRSQPQRRRSARDEKLRRLRQPSSPRDRDGRYRETDQPVTRPRQTRNFREEEERERAYRQALPPSEPRQEPRDTRPAREDRDSEPRPQRPRPQRPRPPRERDYPDERYTNTPRGREIDTEADRYADDEAYRRPVRRSGTRASPPSAPIAPPPKRRARRSVWSTLLIGVIGGIVTIALVVGIGWFFLIHTLQVSFPGLGIGTSNFTDAQHAVPLNITSSITQLQVTNKAGNITISDNSAITTTTAGTLTYVKKTQASSSSNAASDFAHIQVQVQPGNSAACPSTSCLMVSASLPANTAGSVDFTIVLPAQNPTPQFVLNAQTQTGKILVQGFSGLLTLTNNIGDIDVKGGLLDTGSCLQTVKGNITFAGTLETATPPAINPCYGNPITTLNSTQPWYKITSGTGNVDVTLNSLSANIILDATVYDQGKLVSEYPIAISPSSPPSYIGPLLPGTQPTAQLLLSVNTGNITLHKV
jgi:hypothetical protein